VTRLEREREGGKEGERERETVPERSHLRVHTPQSLYHKEQDTVVTWCPGAQESCCSLNGTTAHTVSRQGAPGGAGEEEQGRGFRNLRLQTRQIKEEPPARL
jgi:hypothetical protein